MRNRVVPVPAPEPAAPVGSGDLRLRPTPGEPAAPPAGSRRLRRLPAAALLFLAAGLGGPLAAADQAPAPALAPGSVSVPGLTITLSTDHPTYAPGALHVLSVSASSLVDVTVDAYVVIELPSGAFFSLQPAGGVAPGIVPYLSSILLPAGFVFPPQALFSGSLPPLPVGTFTWRGAFTAPGTLDIVSNLAVAPWTLAEPAPPPPPPPPPPTYVVENRTIDSGGGSRDFVLARPQGSPPGLPLVIVLHGDGGTGAGIRAGLPIEDHLSAIYAYPDAPGGTFEYYTSNGRAVEAQFVQDLIAALQAELAIDTTRVFLAGMSGGATMINALGCYLGPGVIRGLGIHSGTLYPVDDDFTYTPSGGVSCPLPNALFVWGTADNGAGTTYPEGQAVRDNYLATQGCQVTTSPVSPNPCVAYDGCSRAVNWCAIEGMGHSIWSEAPAAMATFFGGLE